MSFTVADVIMLNSPYSVGMSNCDFTPDSLEKLEEMVQDRVTNIISGRTVTDAQKTFITGFTICDLYRNKPGKGTLLSSSIKDDSWRVKITSSSYFMDQIKAVLTDFDSFTASNKVSLDGVRRDDACKNGVVDGAPYRGLPYPSVGYGVPGQGNLTDPDAEKCTGYNNIRVG
jgi:hypothetical protein